MKEADGDKGQDGNKINGNDRNLSPLGQDEGGSDLSCVIKIKRRPRAAPTPDQILPGPEGASLPAFIRACHFEEPNISCRPPLLIKTYNPLEWATTSDHVV